MAVPLCGDDLVNNISMGLTKSNFCLKTKRLHQIHHKMLLNIMKILIKANFRFTYYISGIASTRDRTDIKLAGYPAEP